MAYNILKFCQFYPAVPAVQQILQLPRNPMGATTGSGYGLYVRATFGAAGAGAGNVSLEEWFFAFHYSSSTQIGNDRFEGLVKAIGTPVLAACTASVSSYYARLAWTPSVANCDWLIRGEAWTESPA